MPDEERVADWLGRALRRWGPFTVLALLRRAENRAAGRPVNTPIEWQ